MGPIWKKIRRIFVAVVLLTSIATVASIFFNDQSFFRISSISVIGAEEATSAFAKANLKVLEQDLESYKGVSLWHVKLDEINKRILSYGWVESVSIHRWWPHSLKIIVVPKEISALYLDSNGKLLPVAEDGKLLEEVPVTQAPDVAILRGEEFAKKADLRSKALKVLSEIPKTGRFSLKTISEISFQEKEGFWVSLIENGIRVDLGEDDISVKANRVAQVLEYISKQKVEGRVIDARFSKKVLVKLRKDP